MRILKLFNMKRWFVILFFLTLSIHSVFAQLSAMEFTPGSAACNLTSSITVSVDPCAYDGTGSLVIIATPEVQIVGANPISIANGEGTFQIHIDQGFAGTFDIGFEVASVTNDNGCNTYVGDSFVESFTATCVCPDIDPIGDVTACESFILPTITGTDLTGNQAYYDAPNGGGTMFAEGATITTSGTYYAYDGVSGCDDEESFMVTINPSVTPSVSITASANPVCAGTMVEFTAVPVNAGSDPIYQWKKNGANVGTNSPTYTYVPVNGDVIVCEMTSNAECANPLIVISNAILISVNPNPVLDSFVIQASACGQMNGAIDISVSNCGNSCTYSWFGNNYSSSDEDIAGLAQGTYALTITNSYTCVFDTQLIVPSLNGPQIAAITGLTNGSQYCEGTMVELGVDVSGGSKPYTFLWDDGSTDSARKTVLPTPIQSSEHISYYVTVTDANICSDDQSISVEVFHLVNVNAGNDVSSCVGKEVILMGSIGFGNNPNWSILSGQGKLDPADELITVFSPINQGAGNVQIRLSSGPNGACPGSSDSLIIAYSIPPMPASSNTSFAICAGDTVILSVEQPPFGLSVIWKDANQIMVGDTKDLNVDEPGIFTAHYYDTLLDCEGPGLIFTVTQKTGLPVADITIELPANICSGDVELGVAFPSGSGNVEVEWSIGMTEMMGNPVQYDLSAGQQSGYVTVTDESGCPTRIDVDFNVLQTPLESDYAVDPDRELFCFEEPVTIIAKNSVYTYQFINPTGNTSITDNGNGTWFWDPSGYVGQASVELEVTNESNGMVCSSVFTPTITWRKKLNADFTTSGVAQVGKEATITLKNSLNPANEYAILYVIRPSDTDSIPFNSDDVHYDYQEEGVTAFQVVRGYIEEPWCEVAKEIPIGWVKGASDLNAVINANGLMNGGEVCLTKNDWLCFSAKGSSVGSETMKYQLANLLDLILWVVRKDGIEIYNWEGVPNSMNHKDYLDTFTHCIALEIGMYTISLELQQKLVGDSIEKSNTTFTFSVIEPISEVNFKAEVDSSQQEQVTSGPIDLLYLCPGQTYVINPDFTGIYSDSTSNNFFEFGGNTSAAPLKYTADKPGTSVDLVFTAETAGGCEISDTLRLVIRPQLDVFAADTLRVCSGDTLDVDIDSGFTSSIWSWNDGSMEVKDSTSIHLLLSESATLSIQADSLGCTYSDSLRMQVVKVEGIVEAWPEPDCPNGLYRVVPGSGIVIDYLSPLPGLDTLNTYFFRVPAALLNDTVVIGLQSRELEGCKSEIRDVYPVDANGSALGELYADLCTQTLLVPGNQCPSGEGTWYQIDKLSGAANEVPGAKENYLNQVSDDSLGQYTYVFVCSDSCAQVATTRSDGSHSPPCAPGEISWSFQLIPNPADAFSTLQLVSDAPGNYRLALYDVTGRMMGNTALTLPEGSNDVPIDVARWSSGMYIVVLSDEQGHRQMSKLMISR
ncbi:MAG: T9SS type A sorting domain-containing protein [Saprospiraceae bacterium]